MAFADPLPITVSAVVTNMIKINQDGYSTEYFRRSGLEEYRAKIRHSSYTNKSTGKMVDRHNVEVTLTIYNAVATVAPVTRKSYAVFENERSDGTTDPFNFFKGFVAMLSDANITKLINMES